MKLSFADFVRNPDKYLNNEKYVNGHTSILTNSKILISAPHGVVQTRLGQQKFKEIGSARFALALRESLNSNIIIKTKNLFDDANFDIDCPYRQEMKDIIHNHNIKYLLDIHGLAKSRPCDINLGINFGENIQTNETLYHQLKTSLENAGFVVSVDNPFCGRYPAIAADMCKTFGIWTIQIEINCALTNESNNFQKIKSMLQILTAVFNTI